MRASIVFLTGILTLGAARAVAAPDDISAFVGRTVATIEVVDAGRPAAPEVRSLVVLNEGTPLSLEAVRLSVQSLVTVGRFESVDVSAASAPADRVAVVFSVVPRRPVDDVLFTGDTGLPSDDLHHLVLQQFGAIPTSIRPETMQRTVTSLLQDEGYLAPKVSASIAEAAKPGHAVIAVSVDAGVRATITALTITGTSPLTRAMIMADTGAAEGVPYRRRAIDDALVKLREDLRNERYYQAEAFVQSDPVSADGASVALTLHVDAGPKVFGPFFTGDPRPPGKIEDLVPMALDHAADEDLLDDAQTRLQLLLQRDGYRDAKASYTRTLTDQGLVVTFDIARGPYYRVGDVTVTGNAGLPRDVVTRLFAVSRGQPYSTDRMAAGGAAIRQEYLKRGYFNVKVTAQSSEPGGAAPRSGSVVDVNLSVVIDEGPQAHFADIVFQPETLHVPIADLRRAMRSKTGDPYVKATTAVDQAALETLYRDRGFPTAQVKVTSTPGDDDRAMALTVAIDEGPQIFVQDIRVIGNHRVDTPAILETLTIHAGGPLGAAAVQKSRQDVQAEFGFRTVSIDDEPVLNDDSRRHVIVTVDEAPATTIAWGGGILVDRRPVADTPGGPSTQHLDIGPRGSFEVSRQNLGGRNRVLDFFTRLGVRSNPNIDGNPFSFVDYLVQTQYSEHRAFQLPVDLTFSASSERDVQTDFNYIRQVLKTEALFRATRHVTVTGQYALQFAQLFDQSIPEDQQLLIDRRFAQVRLSVLSSSVLWDRRNDPIAPSNGTLTSADFEVAPKAIGSEVGFVKTLFQLSGYHAIDTGRRFVGAARLELGLAHGFSRDTLKDAHGNDVLDPETGLPIIVAPLPASERFYAGGGSTVRGFNEDVLGVPALITNQGLSLGGNGLVVLNLELRTRVARIGGKDLGVVTFVDGGNVFPNPSDISLTQLRGTVGFGFRYNSPLGPIRLDYGFKLTRLPFGTSGTLEPRWTWHLSVGEAF